MIGREDALIMQAPYEAVSEDPQAIELVFGRRNTFGPLHQWAAVDAAYGPGNFVTEGRAFRDSYVLIKQGLLKEPVIRKERKEAADE